MLYTESIKNNTNFKKMYYRSKFKIGFFTVIYFKANRLKKARLGVTVSKKVGNAVTRNSIRRIIFAAYYIIEQVENFRGYSFVIVARKSCCGVKMWDVFEEIRRNLFFLKKSAYFNNKFGNR